MFLDEEKELFVSKRQRIILEICTILYFLAKNSAIPLVPQYVFQLVSKKYNITAEHASILESNLTREQTTYADALRHRINEESSLIVLFLNIAELLPCAISVLAFGFFSDATGRRRFLLWMPCLGSAFYAAGFLLPLYVNGGNVDHTLTKVSFLLGSLLSGLCGNLPGYLAGNASYISDTDSSERRTMRLAIVELHLGLTFGLVNFANGFWVRDTNNFVQPLWFIFICSIITFFAILVGMREPHGIDPEVDHLEMSTLWGRSVRNMKSFCHVESTRHKTMWAIFCAFQIYVFVQQGQERTFTLFLQSYPLAWDAVKIGCFFLVLYCLSAVGCWPVLPAMMKYASEYTIFMAALISKAMGSFLLGFASDNFTIYLSCVVQFLHLVPFAVCRSAASKQVGDDEQASLYAIMHSAQSIVGFLGPLCHNVLFAVTVRHMRGLVFLVSGFILVVPLLLTMYIKYIQRKDSEYGTIDDTTVTVSTTTGGETPASEKAGLGLQPAESYGSSINEG